MKIIYSAVTLIFFLAGISFAEEGNKYGQELSIENQTEISQILETPEEYEGQKVQVKGQVTGVCKKMGCWIELKDDQNNKMKVKVNDGEIVFPKEAIGKDAVVEGVVYAVEMKSDDSSEKNCAKMNNDVESMTKEKGCCSKEKVTKVYQIKGTGAVIN